jgi:hypothetical protein
MFYVEFAGMFMIYFDTTFNIKQWKFGIAFNGSLSPTWNPYIEFAELSDCFTLYKIKLP